MPYDLADVSRPLPPFDRPPEPRHQPAKGVVKALFLLVAAGVVAGCAAAGGSLAPSVTHGGPRDGANISRALPAASPTPFPADQAGCGPGPANGASCGVTKNPNHPASKTPSGGLSPAQLRAAYGLPAASTTAVAGPAIAIVVAFDNPTAEQDLATYRSQFGLPACSSQNGCFQKVIIAPTPGNPPPAPAPKKNSADATTWADERALDLAMASAACPNCRLVLVEAVGEDLDSLANAVNVAASYGPAAISNSWGVPEGGGNVLNIDSGAQSAFNHPGIAITASAGDLGAGAVQFPASSPYVTSVGGTTLTADATAARGWDETAWTGSGNGCSIMVSLPSWQGTAAPCNGSRSVPDISMLADSTVGAAVYNTAEKGWIVLGGTSLGAPFVAGLYAAAANYGAGTVGAPNIYANLGQFNAVPGTNGSPNGLAGF